MAVETRFAVQNGHCRDGEGVALLCPSPYPYSHVLRRYCSLLVSTSAPIEDPLNPDCSEQSDPNLPPGPMLLNLNER